MAVVGRMAESDLKLEGDYLKVVVRDLSEFGLGVREDRHRARTNMTWSLTISYDISSDQKPLSHF